jgi:GR25 family glycosyltransferase involved in LPS biosynthesis
MNNSFDFFDKIYCINLPKSKDRKNVVSEEFKKLGILDRVIFDFVSPPPDEVDCYILPGKLGCSLSNLKMFFNAFESGANNFLIFEDDVTLNKFPNETQELLKKSIQQLPKDWDIFYLGGKPTKKIKRFNNNLVIIDSPMLGTYAYAFNRKAAKGFIDKMMSGMMTNACDTLLGIYAAESKSFCVYPPLFSTAPGFSYVRQSERDYTENTNDSWKELGPDG